MTANTPIRSPKIAALALGALFAAVGVQAAEQPGAAHARYQRDAAACMRIAPESRGDCLGAAHDRLAQRRPTQPGEAPSVLAENALKRCAPLPDDLRTDCEARMHGAGTVSGSVEGGGLYRELVTVTTGAEPDPEP